MKRLLLVLLVLLSVLFIGLQRTFAQTSATNKAQALAASLTTTGSDVPLEQPAPPVATSDTLPPSRTNVSSPLINLDTFRTDTRFTGIDGSGVAIVVLDTGIDLDHPYFGPDNDSNNIADRIVYQYDFGDNDSDASDVNGHGSNVTSIVAGENPTYMGMAPNANIIHLKVFQDTGAGSFGMVESALQWVVSNAATYNIVSINMSLGDSQNHSAPTSLYGIGDELAALSALNVAVVSSSGNSFHSWSSTQGVGYPSADPNSLSVGAVYDSNVGGFTYGSGAAAFSTDADRITPFSQRHSTMSDIFAPGAPITGAGPTGGTVTMHGTSQAAPHITGIVALMQQLAVQELSRVLSITEVRTLLASSGVSINDGDDEQDNVINTNLNYKRVDMVALGEAILALSPSATVTPGPTATSVSPTPTATPINPTPTATPTNPTPTATPSADKGMTWGVSRYDATLDISRLHCYGGPDGPCNAYQGDMSCSTEIPILCLNVDGSPRPPYAIPASGGVMSDEFYNGWSEGPVGLTAAVAGDSFATLGAANAYCASQFGSGYRVAEHHDGRWVSGMNETTYFGATWPTTTNGGGWGFWADGQIANSDRFWVHINDQDANCWDSSLAVPVTNTQCNISDSSPMRYVAAANSSAADGSNSCTVSSAPCLTIQHAIDQANAGDVVRVAPATYSENINFGGKEITVASDFYWTGDRNDIATTRIDGNQNGSVVTMINAENEYSQLIGFSLSDGSGTYVNNTGYPPTSAGRYRGGGFYLRNAQPMLCDLVVENNSAELGGGMYSLRSEPTISGTIFNQNTASSFGGGLYFESHSQYHPIIINSVVSDNQAPGGAGIFANYSTQLELTHVTIADNSATSIGGGILRANQATISMTNSIVWGNQPASIDWQGGTNKQSNIQYSDIETTGDTNVIYGSGIMTTSPLFGIDYHLTNSSPVIDQGVATNINVDLEHASRTVLPDMGAYESALLCEQTTIPTLLHGTSPTSFEAIPLTAGSLPPLAGVTNNASAVCNGRTRPMSTTPVDDVNFITAWYDNNVATTACYSLFTPIGNGLYDETHIGNWPLGWGISDVADVDNDGNDDLLLTHRVSTGYSNYEYKMALGAGNGSFDFTATPITIVTNQWLYNSVLGDVNGDSHIDLVYFSNSHGGSFSPPIYMRAGDGTGTFASTASTLLTSPTSVSRPVLADFDNNGTLDMFLPADDDVSNRGLGRIAANTGAGVFSSSVPSVDCSPSSIGGTDQAIYRAQAADVNLDGNLDIVCYQHPWNGSLAYSVDVFWGNGDLTFNPTAAHLWDQPNSEGPDWHTFTWTEAPICEAPPTEEPNLLSIYVLALDNDPASPGALMGEYTQAVQGIVDATIGSNDKIAVILADLEMNGDTHILVAQNGNITPIQGLPDNTSVLDAQLSEYDTSNGVQLGAFFTWARATYPADKTSITVVAHNTAFAPDTNISALLSPTTSSFILPTPSWVFITPNLSDHTSEGLISPHDLQVALAEATNNGADPIDVLDTKSCFSSTIEQYYELSNDGGTPYAEVMVGSPNYGYFAPDMLGRSLAAMSPNDTAEALGNTILTTYDTVLAEADLTDGDADVDHPHSLVMVDSSQIPAIKAEIDQLSFYMMQQFNNNAATTVTKLQAAYNNASTYYDTTCDSDLVLTAPDGLVDINALMPQLAMQFGSISGVGLRALQIETLVSNAVLSRVTSNGTPWFGSGASWVLDAADSAGIAMFADFEGRAVGNERYLMWQGHFYNDVVSAENPHPYDFIENSAVGVSWADIVESYWTERVATEGLILHTEVCLPPFAAVQQSAELAVDSIIFPHLGTIHVGYDSPLAAAITTDRIINNAQVQFTVVDSNSTLVYSNTVNTGYLVTGTHQIDGSQMWSPTVAGLYTIDVVIDPANLFLEIDETDNSASRADHATNATPLTISVTTGIQWVDNPTINLNLASSQPLRYLVVQVHQYVAGVDPNIQVPVILDEVVITNPSAPNTTVTLPSNLTAGPVVLHVWGVSTGGDLNQKAEIVKLNYAPVDYNVGMATNYFLFSASAGDDVAVQLAVLAGTVDMFVWQPNNSWSAYALKGSGTIAFDPALAGEYLVKVVGSSADAAYTLTNRVNDQPGRGNNLESSSSVIIVQIERPGFVSPLQAVPEELTVPTYVALSSQETAPGITFIFVWVIVLFTLLTLSLYRRRV